MHMGPPNFFPGFSGPPMMMNRCFRPRFPSNGSQVTQGQVGASPRIQASENEGVLKVIKI